MLQEVSRGHAYRSSLTRHNWARGGVFYYNYYYSGLEHQSTCRPPQAKVTVVGRQWLMAWEDGQRGIYKLESLQAVNVGKSHQLLDSSQPALVENLMQDMQKHYTDQLLGKPSTAPTNDPSMSRASQLLGIGRMLDDEDDAGAVPRAAPIQLQIKDTESKRPVESVVPMEVDEAASQAGWMEALRPQAPAAPKAAVKAKAKGKASAKPKSSAKRGGAVLALPAPPVQAPSPAPAPAPVDENPLKRARTSPIQTMEPPAPADLTSNMASIMNEGDKAWAQEHGDSLQNNLNLAPREAESEFKNDIAERLRDINSLLAKIRARKRCVKRRMPENQEAAMNNADSLETLCNYFASFLRNLQKGGSSGAGDDLMNQFKTLVDKNGAIFGVEVVKRIAKNLVLDDIKYQRWPMLLDTTWVFIKDHMSPVDREGFFGQQVSVALQKLVKGIPADKAFVL